MTWTDDELGALVRTAECADRGGCPGAEELAVLACGELTDSQRKVRVDHLVQCAACARELQELLALRELADRVVADGPAAASEPLRRRRVIGWLAAAAAAAFVAVGLALLMQQRAMVVPPASAAVRGAVPEQGGRVPLDGAVLESAPATLRWKEDGDEFYVTVFDAEGTALWASEWLFEPRATLPPDLIVRFEQGGRFYWQVEARTERGRRRSPPTSFEVRR